MKTDDTTAKVTEKQQKREHELKRRRKCKRLLIERIHDSQLEYVQDKRSPKEIWTTLKNVFERTSVASRMHLQRQILSMKFDGGRLTDHFLRFDRLVREFRGTGAEMSDIDAVCHLLLTLGPAYGTVVTSIETMSEENLTMEFVKCRLLDEETKQRGLGVESFTPANETAAFSGTKMQKKIRCFSCKKEGHKSVDCPEKKKKKPQHSPKQHGAKANVAGSTERTSVCFVGVSGDAPPDMQREVRWFLDSGVSDHLAWDRSLFTEMQKLSKPIQIAVAKDGEFIVAEYSGTVKMLSAVGDQLIECTVKNVLFIPQLRCNLFSVARIEKAGMRVVFDGGKALIYNGDNVVACGVRRCSGTSPTNGSGLYVGVESTARPEQHTTLRGHRPQPEFLHP